MLQAVQGRIQFQPEWLGLLDFSDSPAERHLASQISCLTVNWGRLEYQLFLILEAIDPKQLSHWIEDFFSSKNLEPKKKLVKKKYSMRSIIQNSILI
jgi:hypothetical protein